MATTGWIIINPELDPPCLTVRELKIIQICIDSLSKVQGASGKFNTQNFTGQLTQKILAKKQMQKETMAPIYSGTCNWK